MISSQIQITHGSVMFLFNSFFFFLFHQVSFLLESRHEWGGGLIHLWTKSTLWKWVKFHLPGSPVPCFWAAPWLPRLMVGFLLSLRFFGRQWSRVPKHCWRNLRGPKIWAVYITISIQSWPPCPWGSLLPSHECEGFSLNHHLGALCDH